LNRAQTVTAVLGKFLPVLFIAATNVFHGSYDESTV